MIVIVECGVNHEGSIDVAFEMILSAMQAGAKVVKFQLYDPYTFLNEDHPLYTRKKMLKETMDNWPVILEFANKNGLLIGFSVFTRNYWEAHIHSDFIKIAARQLDNRQELVEYLYFIENYVYKNKPLFVSYREDQDIDSLKPLFDTKRSTYFMGVISKYPTPYEEAMEFLQRFSKKNAMNIWGYSSHTPNYNILLQAKDLGSLIAEVHFTLDTNQSPFRDHSISLNFEQLSFLLEEVSKDNKKIIFN